MRRSSITVNGVALPVIRLDTAVVGSGCAGLNAADWLHDFGRRDIAILTEGVNMGTSRNTGSDKQTYYKLSLCGAEADSVATMASDLFSGGGVNGDTALAEAAGSVRSFMKLCNLGVPFPTNEYGEYIGYKTDHDPKRRATSAGPLTSKMMTECLEKSVRGKGIPILDGMMAVRLLTLDAHIVGLICLDKTSLSSPACGLTLISASQVILASGGPAGCYLRSVYPKSQTGMSGLALEAGAAGANLQEWQYGLASLKFRWNVSGTYQQVLPRYISLDHSGVEREFLPEYFVDPVKALDSVFLKGYQWPFDAHKIHGSSLIDVLVHHETETLGRRVFMDFRHNPAELEQGFERLSEETRLYLSRSRALCGTPIERLEIMNKPAIDLYLRHGIDLYAEPLEIGVCAQHHNGGIAVDAAWQSSIQGLYVTGEAAGTFGVKRPGGSALNSTQVGSFRAAEHIAQATEPVDAIPDDFLGIAAREAAVLLDQLRKSIHPGMPSRIMEERMEMSGLMSRYAGHMRDACGMAALEARLREKLERFYDDASVKDASELPDMLKNRDIFVTQLAILSAMRLAADELGSRGSALVMAEEPTARAPVMAQEGMPTVCAPVMAQEGLLAARGLQVCYVPGKPQTENLLITTEKSQGGFGSRFESVRPLPTPNDWFESVWRDYRARTRIGTVTQPPDA